MLRCFARYQLADKTVDAEAIDLCFTLAVVCRGLHVVSTSRRLPRSSNELARQWSTREDGDGPKVSHPTGYLPVVVVGR